MKKGIAAIVLSLALTFTAGAVSAEEITAAAELTSAAEENFSQISDTRGDLPTDQTAASYSVFIAFNGNGGLGTMANMTVTSGSTVNLTPNAFTRTGFTFAGWNTKADGKGMAYANLADVSQLASAENNGQTITLYAQWKINAPKIKKVKKLSPAAVKVTWSKNSKAAGYEIQYAVSSKFKKASKISVSKKESGKEVSGLTPGKTNYIRIRSYYKNGKKKVYGDWSSAKKIKMPKGSTIENTKALTSIEADVTLTGSGSGYHAKLVLCTQYSAVSFGIQHDEHAAAPYTGKTMALIENVAHNGAGGQQYIRPGNVELQRGKTYKMMITVDKKGKGNVYLDYKKIGSFSNAGLANQAVYIRVEGAVRLNGDSVKATFDNIKLRQAGKFDKVKCDKAQYGGWFPKSNASIHAKKIDAKNKVVISGKGSGINGDWDSDYENVSGIFQFY